MAQVSIKIGASTTEYQQAMKQAAASMKELSSEYSLAAANAKLYGNQSDALRAKITELNGKMDVQKDKIKINEQHTESLNKQLKNAESDHKTLSNRVTELTDAYQKSAYETGEDSEQTKKLKSELEKAEKQLSANEKAIDGYKTSIKNSEAATTAAKAGLANFEVQLKEVRAELARQPFDEYATKANKVGSALESAGKTMSKVSAVIAGIGTYSVKTAASFEAEMSKVSAISGATGDDLEKLTESARQWGRDTSFSATESAQAFEYMAMAGWKTEDMLDGIGAVLNLAAASGEDLARTSDIVTDALTGFGLTAKDSSHFADVLAVASSNANTNVGMMGETFKYVAPVAGSLGYSAEDVAEAIGLMANSGIKASQAGTSLRSIMTRLATDAGSSSKSLGALGILTEKLGVQFYDSEGKVRPFNDVITESREAWKNLTAEEQANYAKKIAGQNAFTAWSALMNASTSDVEKLEDALANCDGAAEKMAQTMLDNLQGQLTILKSKIDDVAITIGNILIPYVSKVIDVIGRLTDKFAGLDSGTQKTIVTIAAVVAAIGPLLLGIGKLITFSANVSTALGTLSAALAKAGIGAATAGTSTGAFSTILAAITSPVGIAVAAIAAITAVVITLWNTNEDFRNAIKEIWSNVKETFSSFANGIKQRLGELGISFSDITGAIKAIWEGFCNILAPVITGALNIILSVVDLTFNQILNVFDFFKAVFTGDWKGAWNAIQSAFSAEWKFIKDTFTAVIDTLKGIADVFLSWFGTSWNQLWTSVKNFFTSAWNAIKTTIGGVVDGIKTAVSNGFNAAKTTTTNIFNAVKDTTSTVWNGIKTTISGMVDGIKTAVSNGFNAAKTTATNIFNSLAEIVTTVWNTIKNVIQVALMFIAELFHAAFEILTIPFKFIWVNFGDIIVDAWNGIKSTISGAIDNIKTVATNGFNAVKNIASTIFNAVKSTATTIWNGIKSTISGAIDNIKTVATNGFNAVKNIASTAFTAVKNTTTTAWNNVKSAITKPINDAKTAVGSAVDTIKSKFKFSWSLPKVSTSNLDSAKTAVGNVISAIKSKLNFSWSLPKLKMPHPKISGNFSLNPPSVPKFSIEWYKTGGIMTRPTIFGAAGNTLLAGGEAGSEAILPLAPFYENLAALLDEKFDKLQQRYEIHVTVVNEMDGEVIAEKTTDFVTDRIVSQYDRRR